MLTGYTSDDIARYIVDTCKANGFIITDVNTAMFDPEDAEAVLVEIEGKWLEEIGEYALHTYEFAVWVEDGALYGEF